MTAQWSRSVCVIVPILNERKNLTPLLRHLERINPEQVILVDGGSSDDSVAWVSTHWADQTQQRLLVQSAAGRALQMNTGAKYAATDMLLFLHADTRLPEQATLEIASARDKNYFWGRFDVEFEPASRINLAMRIIAKAINIRSRLTSVATGDQAIFIDRGLFAQVGGFPEIPLMEDVAMCKSLRKLRVPFCSYLQVRTSARRWQHNGVIRTVLQMWFLRFAYFVGVSPERLARAYRNVR